MSEAAPIDLAPVKPGGAARFAPAMPHLWAMAVLVAIFVAVGLSHIEIGDFWWHLRLGEVIVSTRQIPAADTFSFTALGMPYTYQQWLGELFLYGLFSLGGLELVVLGNMLLWTGLAALVMATAYELSRDLRVAALCTAIGMFVGLSNRDARPQSIAFLLFALCQLILVRNLRNPRSPLWMLPLLGALWANVHGSVVLGFMLCALTAAGTIVDQRLGGGTGVARPRRLSGWSGAFAVAALLNPWGLGLLDYILTIGGSSVVQSAVTEWASPTIRNAQDLPLFGLLLACVGLFALSSHPLKVSQALVFIAFAALALQAERNSIWFGIVAAPIIAEKIALWTRLRPPSAEDSLGRPPAEPRHSREGGNPIVPRRHGVFIRAASRQATRDSTDSSLPSGTDVAALPKAEMILNSLFAALLLAIALLFVPWVKPYLPLPPSWRSIAGPGVPAAAVQFVAASFPNARTFHADGYGSYMIWASPNKPSVFVDTRVELYPPQVWQDYIQISWARDWEELLAKYGIATVVLPKEPFRDLQRPLLRALAQAPNWTLVYEDSQALVYVKKD